MAKHEYYELQQYQALPLSAKVEMTNQRIKDWVEMYGEDHVHITFSGGKDSTVLVYLVRQLYPNVPAVFVDTGLEYPEIRRFVKAFSNTVILKPSMNFKSVVFKYGYPFISKEVSDKAHIADNYISKWLSENYTERIEIKKAQENSAKKDVFAWSVKTNSGQKKSFISGDYPDELLEGIFGEQSSAPEKAKMLFGHFMMTKDGEKVQSTRYNYSRHKYLINFPWRISAECCNVMKKAPIHKYEKETGSKGMTGQMAAESNLRTRVWMNHGCNMYDLKNPISNPMAFWTDQDVLNFIYMYGEDMISFKKREFEAAHTELSDKELEKEFSSEEWQRAICSVYGDIQKVGEEDGQMNFQEIGWFETGMPTLKTSGCKRTGCMFCGYGCHLEKRGEGRFLKMKETHPQVYDYVMRPEEKGGLNYKEVIDWLNENGGWHIEY